MSRVRLSTFWIAAFALVACKTNGGVESDGQSHWLGACASSAECGDAQCLCGVCTRGCEAASECGSLQSAQCVEVALLGGACANSGSETRICLPESRVPSPPPPPPMDAAQAMPDARSVDMPRAGANSVGVPDGGGAGTTAATDAAVAMDAGDAAAPFDAAVCEGFDPEVTQSPTVVRLVNGTTQQLFLGSTQVCSGEPPFTLATAAGTEVYGQGGGCAFSCLQIQQSQCSCEPYCPSAPVISLMPGEHYDRVWQGTIFTVETLPEGCFPKESCGGTGRCLTQRTVEEALTVTGFAYPEFACREGATCGPCQQNGGGNCVIFDADRVRGTPRTATAAWSPGQAMVTITF